MSTAYPSIPVNCFGEILWDVLPDGPQPGGAPLNVAYHLTQLNVPTALITRVGKDQQGEELAQLMAQWGIGKELLQRDPIHETSRVLARMNSKNEVSYEIVFPVAWDFIEADAAAVAAVKAAAYFVYGSLAARNTTSRETLLQLLEHAQCKVLDINLRPPFFNNELLEALLLKADLLKVNQSELEMLQQVFGSGTGSETEQVALIKSRFNIREMIVTKGEHGASYYTLQEAFHEGGIPVEVCDTIGSGDSFLAAFIAGHLRKEAPAAILKKAVAMGAFIAGKKGGCPEYHLSEYLDFGSRV